MSKEFGNNEKRIRDYFPKGETFTFKGSRYKVVDNAQKPVSQLGECKTDIFFKAENQTTGEIEEFKISYKQANANFLENKTNAERAEALLGSNWKNLIETATRNKRDEFEKRKLIFKDKKGNTEAGSITLGWKFELLNINSGDLAGEIDLTTSQKKDVYAGTNLPTEKKNAKVDGVEIINSGVANYIFVDNGKTGAQGVIDSIQTIEDYLGMKPNIYFACKALNYRSKKKKGKKWDGDRPLAVQVNWDINDNNKLTHSIEYASPLDVKGNDAASKLAMALKKLNIKNADDLNENNVEDTDIIYKKEKKK